jgi:hypothetical protein
VPAPLLALAFLLSSALAWQTPRLDPTGSLSASALALYPWIVLAGVPRAARPVGPGPAGWRTLALESTCVLPPLVLALRIEHWQAADGGLPWLATASGWILVVALAAIAEAARCSRRLRGWHALAWFVLLGAALIPAVLGWGDARLSSSPRFDALRSLSPFAWIHGRVANRSAVEVPLVALALLLVLVVLFGAAARRDPAVPARESA